MTRPPRSNFFAAFTLIELLVVVSIISLLIALLLPALRAARAQARGIRCAANVKQVGVAFEVYLQDYDRVYPPRFWNLAPSPARWHNPDPKLDQQYWFHLINANAIQPGTTYSTPQDLFKCPDDEDFKWAGSSNKLSYGYNYYGSWIAPDTGVEQINDVELVVPSRTIVVGDSIDDEIMLGNAPPGSPQDSLSVGKRHPQETANLLWADSHVSREDKKEADETTAWWTRMAD